MELLILLIIVVVLCLILDVSMNVIVLGLIALIGMVSGLFALAFLGCVICLLGCKRKPATFLRIDNAKGSKFQVAYYMVDGREYPCIFPKEVVLENKLYRTDRTYHVMVHEKLGKLFDRFAIITCALGLMAGSILCVGVCCYLLS